MAEQVKQEIARVSLVKNGGGVPSADEFARIVGAVEAANRLGHEVCCDVRSQNVAGQKDEAFASPLSLEFFVYVSDRRRS